MNTQQEDAELREQITGALKSHVRSDTINGFKWAVDNIEQLIKARDAAKEREAWLWGRTDVLNELNHDLFYATTEPSGHFIKEVLVIKIDAAVEARQKLKSLTNPQEQDKEEE